MEQPNLDYLKEISDGQPEVIAQFVGIIKEEFPGEFEQYQQLMKEKDWQHAAAMVHKLKHKISILGLEKSYEFTIQYEKELLNGDKSNHEDFFKILTTMSDFLTK